MFRRVLTGFLALLLFGSGLPSNYSAEPSTQHLFVSGAQPYPRFRIPALLLTSQGSLLAFCEGRRGGGGLIGDIDIVLRRSEDNGRTWGELELVADDGEDTLGNPCPVIDRRTGKIWLLLTVSPGKMSEEEIVDGATRSGTRVLVTSSGDEGKTWSKPRDITAQAKRPEWTWYGTGPGVGIQLSGGRLFVPSYHTEPKSKLYRSHGLFSDDGGQTWKYGASLGDHTSESAALERSDGELYYSARTVVGKNERTVGDSADAGDTFKNVRFDSGLHDAHCQASLLALSARAVAQLAKVDPSIDPRKPLWLYCYPAGPRRRNLTIVRSSDEGRTWGNPQLLNAGDSQYSSLAELPDGALGCLYEAWRDGNYQLYFARLPLEWLVESR